jgi:hypothetical protein
MWFAFNVSQPQATIKHHADHVHSLSECLFKVRNHKVINDVDQKTLEFIIIDTLSLIFASHYTNNDYSTSFPSPSFSRKREETQSNFLLSFFFTVVAAAVTATASFCRCVEVDKYLISLNGVGGER